MFHHNRSRLLGQNPDKSLKSFPPCHSQSPLQLCLKISYFFKLTQPLTVYTVQLLHTVKGDRRKTWWKTIPPSLWFKKSIKKPLVWELTGLCPETSTKLYVREFGFWTELTRHRTVLMYEWEYIQRSISNLSLEIGSLIRQCISWKHGWYIWSYSATCVKSICMYAVRKD